MVMLAENPSYSAHARVDPSFSSTARAASPSGNRARGRGNGRGGGRGGVATSKSAARDTIQGRDIFGGGTAGRDDDERKGLATRSLAQLRSIVETEEEALALRRGAAETEQSVEQGLRQALAWASTRRCKAEASERQLHVEESEAASDVRVLATDLPLLLRNRCDALQQSLVNVEVLSERARRGRESEEFLDEERERLNRHARSLRQQAELVLQHSGSAFEQCRSSEVTSQQLNMRNVNLVRCNSELDAWLQREAVLEEQQATELAKLRSEAARLRVLVPEMRHQQQEAAQQVWEREESVHLARRLETEDLGRLLAFQKNQLQDKAREATWWRDRANQLGHVLEQARLQRNSQVSELARNPILQGPFR